jgi:hypothetical protein
MTRKRRSTLKRFFEQGALPTAEHFRDFIDSTVNQVDDGFDKDAKDGLRIASIKPHDALISFFRESRLFEHALWTVSYDGDRDKLLFKRLDEKDQAQTVLSLSPDGKVGINRKDPECPLDVEGAIRTAGRIGTVPEVPARDDNDERPGPPVRANGRWHDITGPLTGCHAFEVMAGAGRPNAGGRWALMHATALNVHNPRGLLFNFLNRKNPIKCQHAYYSARGFKLQLRWARWDDGKSYSLQLRSRCDYGGEVYIRHYVTRLWFDQMMRGSSSAEASAFPDLEGEGPSTPSGNPDPSVASVATTESAAAPTEKDG